MYQCRGVSAAARVFLWITVFFEIENRHNLVPWIRHGCAAHLIQLVANSGLKAGLPYNSNDPCCNAIKERRLRKTSS